MSFMVHLRGLWGNLWPLPFTPLLFLATMVAIGDVRVEHVIIVAALVGLGVGNATSRNLLIAGIPGVAIGLGYEVIRYLRPLFVTAERVLGCDLRALELRLFGVGPDTTLADYFVARNSVAADLFFAVPYTLFWFVAIGYGIALYFYNRPRMHRYLWTLAIAHAVAFAIWLALPAAPPWYVRLHGCLVDIDALPSAAALLRVDALLGIGYFQEFYSRAPTVFGALPSLHLAFPAAALVTAWRDAGRGERTIHFAYLMWMLAASVYLDHHWLLDGLLGIGIVLVVFLVLERLWPHPKMRILPA